jgi:hypothetical protein
MAPVDELTRAPERSLAQRRSALVKANDHRTRRAALKRDLKAGRTSVVGLILDPPDWLATMKLFDLLLALPKHGRVKANRIVVSNQVSPSKTVGGLSERQRGAVIDQLRVRRG